MAEAWTARARRLLALDLLLTFALLVATVAMFEVVSAHNPDHHVGSLSVDDCPAWKTKDVGNSIVDLARAGGRCRVTAGVSV